MEQTAANFGLVLPAGPKAGQAAHALLWQHAGIVLGFIAYLALLGAAAWAVLTLVPDQFSWHLTGHDLTLHDIHHKIFSNAGLLLLILPSVFWLECVMVGWKKSSVHQILFALTPSIKTDIAFLLMDQAHLTGQLGRLMMLGLSIMSGEAIQAWLAAHTGFSLSAAALPLALQVVLYFYVYSFFDYWAHRVGHLPWFWPLHRYHHSAEEMSVVNAERIHPAGFVGLFFLNIPMAVLGASSEAMIYVNAATIALGYVIHSRIDSDFGWVGRTLIQSPLHHRLHHKLDMSTPTGHFSMAPIWDHLFGGWGGKAHKDMPISVDTAYRHGFWVMPDLMRDYFDFFKGLVGRRALSASESVKAR